MNLPTISVIIPVFNTEKYLEKCLNSVLGQTFQDIEVICVDDGSTDSSLNILRDYERKDQRVTVLSKEHGDAGAARNFGMKYATGSYFSFLDADDFFEHEMLEKAYNCAISENSDLVVFRSNAFYEDTKEYVDCNWTIHEKLLPEKSPFSADDVQKDFFKLFVGWPWDKLFSSDLIKDNNIYFQEQRTTNDLLFVFSALLKANRISIIDDILAHHRKYKTSISNTREETYTCFISALSSLKEKLIEWGMFSRFERDYVNYCLHFSLWNLKTLTWPIQEQLYKMLKEDVFDKMGVNNRKKEYFYNQSEYNFYEKVINNSYESVFPGVKKEKSDRPKVTVVLPSLNVAKYIRECLESVVNQTLKEIEIICVDAGSTDGTLEIIREFEKRDPRVTVIISEKKSYGHQMNLGLDAATGEYFGIVETDDWILPEMFQDLYECAQEHDVDLVKSDFYRFTINPDGSLNKQYNQLIRNEGDKDYYGRVLTPGDDPRTFKFVINTWCGIYKLAFLRKWKIRHNETPGASYQDNGFWFQTFCQAESAYFICKPYYMNRRDNENSSVFSKEKVYAMRDEYNFVRSLIEADKERLEKFIPLCTFNRFRGYLYNTIFRIAPEYRREFIHYASNEFLALAKANEIDKSLFTAREWGILTQIMYEPEQFIATQFKDGKEKDSSSQKQSEDRKGKKQSIINSVLNYFNKQKKCEKEGKNKANSVLSQSTLFWGTDSSVLEYLNKCAIGRVDMHLTGSSSQGLSVVECDPMTSCKEVNWAVKNGTTLICQSCAGRMGMTVRCESDGVFRIWLRGEDYRDEQNKRILIWVDYQKLVVNGDSIISNSFFVSYENPYCYKINVKSGTEISVYTEWFPDGFRHKKC